MSYDVAISNQALEDLADLPLPVANFVEQAIRRLAEDPTKLGRPCRFPYPLGQIYELEHDFEDYRYYLAILFKYGQDERTLHIVGVGRNRYRLT